MTTINEQNSNQIRKPMEVYVRMDLSDKSITMTYSGYSSAKIADGKLDQTDWKMRKLTDLQGDGYPLDSSCALYNPNTTASASSGKIGVRGNIGQPVSVTITGSSVMDSATIIVTGASSVSHDGGTSAIIGSSVIVSIEDSSATLTFSPKSADRRVEISDIVPGVMFNVTNENMISCTLSLRADLSIVDPTLPESELNLEFYNDEDISEILAAIPEDTPITYRAGYDGDLSPERKFYVAGQVTYKDNVISVHAVDAVHLIRNVDGAFSLSVDDEMVEDMTLTNLYRIEEFFESVLDASRITYEETGWIGFNDPAYVRRATLVEDGSDMRQLFADIMNLFHIKGLGIYVDQSAGYDQSEEFWPSYVDAGRPKLQFQKSPKSRVIQESDCADVIRSIDRKIESITFNNEIINIPNTESVGRWEFMSAQIGKVTSYKNGSAFVAFDGYAYNWVFNLLNKEISNSSAVYATSAMMPTSTSGGYHDVAPRVFAGDNTAGFGTKLVGPDTPQYVNDYGYTVYTQVVPWNAYYFPDEYWFSNMAGMWTWLQSRGYVSSSDESLEVRISGMALAKESSPITVGDGAEDSAIEIKSTLLGQVYGSTTDGGRAEEIFPSKSLQSLFDRSPNTGSFTWKGDPRMQPRDVFTFVRLDGTEIDCTIEQIDLEHVGGGTTAKITYREGIV